MGTENSSWEQLFRIFKNVLTKLEEAVERIKNDYQIDENG